MLITSATYTYVLKIACMHAAVLPLVRRAASRHKHLQNHLSVVMSNIESFINLAHGHDFSTSLLCLSHQLYDFSSLGPITSIDPTVFIYYLPLSIMKKFLSFSSTWVCITVIFLLLHSRERSRAPRSNRLLPPGSHAFELW